MTSEYLKAVDFAKDFFKDRIVDGKLKTHRAEPTEFLYMFGLPIEQRTDDHEYCPTYYVYPEYALRFLLLQMGEDKGAFDLLSRIVISRLFRDEELSHGEKLFVGQIVAGLLKPPPPEGAKLAITFVENLHLLFISRELTEIFGLSLTRNDEVSVGLSACDAVSEALASLGVAKSWRAIKDVNMHPSSQRVREVADSIRKYQIKHRNERPSGGEPDLE
ncbi:MAG: hypothetical protein WBB85_18735 [Albidovulum sp.]|uniref:hypothetical protein n=1 Tax=Albidovulum sp. TaxID=1872424 RepID=UPI003C852527